MIPNSSTTVPHLQLKITSVLNTTVEEFNNEHNDSAKENKPYDDHYRSEDERIACHYNVEHMENAVDCYIEKTL